MLHGIGLRPMSAQEENFAHCDGRPKALPLDSTTLLEKGGRKTFVMLSVSVCKTGSLCVSIKMAGKFPSPPVILFENTH